MTASMNSAALAARDEHELNQTRNSYRSTVALSNLYTGHVKPPQTANP